MTEHHQAKSHQSPSQQTHPKTVCVSVLSSMLDLGAHLETSPYQEAKK